MMLLDTCTLLWWTIDPDHLSEKAALFCSKINKEGAFISSITIWEIGIKIKKGLLDIGESLKDYVARLKLLGSLEIIPIDENIWMKNIQLPWNHKDPADRTIVATAMLKKLPIVTKDSFIRDFYKKVIW